MASPPAARVGDPITHTNAMTGLVVGLGVGLLVGAAIVATGGAAAPLAIAAAAATGGSLGGMAGKFIGGLSTQVKGQIVDGSPNVFINGRQAGFCTSPATCSDHPAAPMVAQGSSTVGINGRPAARTGDKGACDFAVGEGSPNVSIGGAPAACVAIASEVPWWADAGLMVLGLAGGGVSLALKGLSGAAIAARLGGTVAGGYAGGAGGSYAGGIIFGEGSTGQSVMAFGGSLVGGYGGYRGGARLDATPRLNPFNYRPYAAPNTLGSNLGNVRGRYVGPQTQGTGLTARPTTGAPPNTPNPAAGRAVNLREQYMGRTPSKYSRTGRSVVDRMRTEGAIEGEGALTRGNPNNLRLRLPDGSLHPIDETVDMAHRTDAVSWWNQTGRQYGPRSPEVRRFMLDPDNYELQPRSVNRSAGARLGERYLPPETPDFGTLEP